MIRDESNLPPSQPVHDAPLPESTQRVSQQRGISRRTILIGFAGLAGLVGIGLIGDKLLQRSPQPFHSLSFAIYHDPSGCAGYLGHPFRKQAS